MSEEVSPEVIQQTQKILGKYVKRPQLTEKLLRKPPFRFLHDVVGAVVRETGFLKGLYSAEEMVSDNVKEREKKVAFLNKLIEATEAISGEELTVKSSKIVAGLEPTQTNLLLQAIGKSIDKKLDSTEYVQQLKQTSKGKNAKAETKTKAKAEDKSKSKRKAKEAEGKKETKERRSRDRSENKTLVSPSEAKKKEERKRVEKGRNKEGEKKDREKISVSPKENKNDKKSAEVVIDVDKEHIEIAKGNETGSITLNEGITEIIDKSNTLKIDNTEKSETAELKLPQNRPKSARPRSGNTKPAIEQELPSEPEPQNEDISKPPPTNTLRPPSVRPSSARPGAPRLRPDSALSMKEPVTMGKINVIVENFDGTDDKDEDTVVVETEIEEVEERTESEVKIPEEKGQLVEEILKQMTEEEKEKASGDWQTEDAKAFSGFKTKSVARDIEQLRNSLQNLTKIANPFGKLISYLHEDIESMYNEMNMWKNMKRQTYQEIKKHEKMREELCKPLLDQLTALEHATKKQEDDIMNMRAKVLRNDVRIKQLQTQLI